MSSCISAKTLEERNNADTSVINSFTTSSMSLCAPAPLFLRSHLQDLKEVTHNIHYETYRAKRLNENGGLHPITCNDTQESNL